jgi:uncharacterized protein with NRDE domain
MCLILLSYKKHPRYPFIFAANRDEFYERPSAPAALWEDAPEVLGGRDLREGGTWLGITRKGRIAALTNYRDPASLRINALSRGLLVHDYLTGRKGAPDFLDHLKTNVDRYNGFNLILGEWPSLYYFSHAGKIQEMKAGLFGLSNRQLDTPWPKLEKGKTGLKSIVDQSEEPDPEALFSVLADRSRFPDGLLPDTGIGLEWERILSAIFIVSPTYGTRSSTVIMIDRKGHVTFIERVYNGHPESWLTTRFDFAIQAGSLSGGNA